MSRLTSPIVFLLLSGLLSACGHQVDVSTHVHEDGSLERKVILSLEDSASAKKNMFGISGARGWDTRVKKLTEEESRALKKTSESSKGDFVIEFNKKFASAEESNKEMNSSDDTLFHIKSSFEKKFRWFFTHLTYTDTYVAANRFHHVAVEDFFTPEDHAFIERLPAGGVPISSADSVFLKNLDLKIEEDFAQRGLFEEYFHAFLQVMKDHQVESRWLDTLKKYKETIYHYEVVLKEDKKDTEKDDPDDFGFLFKLADSLRIPLPQQAKEDFKKRSGEIESRTGFMNEVITGTYIHSIQMPWTIFDSNADSVAGNTAFWKPHYLKFGLRDYEMKVESRKLNYLPAGVSIGIVVLTVAMLVRRKRSV